MRPESDEQRADDLIRRARELNDVADYAAAMDTARQAVELDPANAEAHRVRAWALENLGPDRLEDAKAGYERAVALDPAAFRARTALADLLRRSGRVEEAERLYREVADDASAATTAASSDLCRLEMGGWSQYRLGRLEDAIATFRIALEQDDDQPSVRFDLALALLAAGEAADARQTYETAITSLRRQDAAHRVVPLTVASEDVEDALVSHPSIVDLPETEAIKTLLRAELREVGSPGRTATD